MFISFLKKKFPHFWGYYLNGKHEFQLIRGISSKFRTFPHFLIIGVPKAGTTSLFNYLIQNENVLSPNTKETHFFNRNYIFGKDWYKANFPIKFLLKGRITGEATPEYSNDITYLEKIKKLIPFIKMIMILRDPIDRAFSEYQMYTRLGHEKRSFYDAITSKENSDKMFGYKRRGLYLQQIKNILTLFNQDQLLIIEFNELVNFPEKLMKKVCKFLEISDTKNYNFKNFNKTEYETTIDNKSMEYLLKFFEEPNNQLFNFLGKKYAWK